MLKQTNYLSGYFEYLSGHFYKISGSAKKVINQGTYSLSNNFKNSSFFRLEIST